MACSWTKWTGQNAETVGRKLKSIAKASEHGLQSSAGRLQTGGPSSEAGDPRPRSSEAAVPSGRDFLLFPLLPNEAGFSKKLSLVFTL